MGNILLLSANPSIIEPKSGGSERSFHLLDALSEHDVTILAFGWSVADKNKQLSGKVKFISISPTEIGRKYATKSREKLIGKSWDLAIHDYAKYDTKYFDKLNKLKEEADLIIVDHYAIAPFVKNVKEKIFYLSHNCEIDLAKQLYPQNSIDVQITREMESIALDKCIAYSACSKEDIDKINLNYSVNKPGYVVPNGTDIPTNIKPGSNAKSKNIVFIGSGHPPNVTAALNVVPLARLLPDYNFILCGDASNAVVNAPSNVKVLGRVDNHDLDLLLRDAFAFVNPMETGSGTHLKVMRALSYGLPILSSKIGSRGFSDAEVSSSMLIGDTAEELSKQINVLQDKDTYEKMSKGARNVSLKYDWKKIKKDYALIIDNLIGIKKSIPKVKRVIDTTKPKENVLLYSLMRNTENFVETYYKQIIQIPSMFPEYNFYLSIYENDSDDKTRNKIFSKDWSKFAGISITSEKLNTQYFGSVKEEERVKNLSIARNKAIEASDFLDKADYVMMIEGDIKYSLDSVNKLLNFKDLEPDFDIVSTISLRRHNSRLYDVWATRQGPVYQPGVYPLKEDYKQKPYDKYYATSNGICLYRAKPFQEGVRHHWINSKTKQFDCEMVVLCQKFHEKGYKNIYILHDAPIYHD